MNKFLSFNHFITPELIQILFFILVIADFISAIGAGFSVGGFWGFVIGVAYLVLAVILSRVFCELLIVVFKINENLAALREDKGI
jgi:uncharacterized membrane protein (DUF485 family)